MNEKGISVSKKHGCYIGGAWLKNQDRRSFEVLDSRTAEPMGAVLLGTAEDVDRAAKAAAAALDAWSARDPRERAAYLRRIASGVRVRGDELIALISREVGTAYPQSRAMQWEIVAHSFEDAANAAEEMQWTEVMGNSVIHKVPAGVVGAITPWNFPLYQIALKVAPALAAGCTVVVKPSEVAGLSPLVLTEIIDEVGLPAGVFNLVSGDGPEVGEAIATHPLVDMVSFTGSDRAGKRVAEIASASVKRLSLELGGKSANIVLPGADLAAAVAYGVASCYNNAGQTCAALTRMIVMRERLADVERIACDAARSFVEGDPLDPEVKLGPLVSEIQRDRVVEYIRQGVREGASLLVGNPDGVPSIDRGYYVPATVFSDVTPEMTIAREEIFGPVLSIIPVDSIDEAVAVANGTSYGLNAAVWAADEAEAERVALCLNASTVYLNGGRFNPSAPFGGTKQSGYGRERGPHGVAEFLQTKALQR